ncbi:RNA polymerase sigma factor [Pedobacter fastidiosus]|uniref:RNA polymerase sigma factor n=1 Tax=Pedobacter fastidiosus TaxID=2765361 RepID=UPI00293BDE96|nr:sigma factor [Pedobacter fastidiosus]
MNQLDFTQATEALQPQLYSHALKFTKDEDDAKDLLQDTLIKGYGSATVLKTARISKDGFMLS